MPSEVDCNHPDVKSGTWAYGAAVCKSISLGTSAAVLDAQRAEMDAAGWTGGGWNAYQDALAKRARRKGSGAEEQLPPPAPFPFVQLGAAALGIGALVYWWRS